MIIVAEELEWVLELELLPFLASELVSSSTPGLCLDSGLGLGSGMASGPAAAVA